jgi:NADH dehydrogenase FAD-containing subunit
MSKGNRKSIVVVGGGASGATITRILSSKIDANTTSLTLVTARPFALHLPAAIRMTTTAEGKLEDTVLIPYDNLLVKGNGTVKVGRVTAIEEGKEGQAGGSVTLSTGEQIHYDILVLAPGSEWDGPLSFPDDRAAVLEHIRSWRRKFENANGIVLAGGGAVGIGTVLFASIASFVSELTFVFSYLEYAGEIKDAFPQKKVTIVHSDSMLLNAAYPNKYRKRIEKDITSRGINIVFNDYIDDFESASPKTRSGRQVEGDFVVSLLYSMSLD